MPYPEWIPCEETTPCRPWFAGPVLHLCYARLPTDPDMPAPPFTAYLYPVLLLVASNVFMTIAWYGHLKYRSAPLLTVILVSWGIAFFEYCLQVPGNRLGAAVYSAPQLKGMQEVITLVVFAVFSAVYLGQPLKWNHWAAFALIVVAALLMFKE